MGDRVMTILKVCPDKTPRRKCVYIYVYVCIYVNMHVLNDLTLFSLDRISQWLFVTFLVSVQITGFIDIFMHIYHCILLMFSFGFFFFPIFLIFHIHLPK